MLGRRAHTPPPPPPPPQPLPLTPPPPPHTVPPPDAGQEEDAELDGKSADRDLELGSAPDSEPHGSEKKHHRVPPPPAPGVQGERGVFDVDEGEDGVPLMDWKMASVLVVKVAYGIGVMGIPATFASLGFVGGIICLLVLWGLCTLSGVYVARVRLRHPGIHSVADFGGVLFGPVGAELFGGIYIVLMVLVAGASISTVTIALNAVSSHALCTSAWAGVACAIVFVFGALVPDMERVAFISWIGVACIFVSNWILTIAVLVKGHPPDKPPGAPLGITVPVSIPFWQAMNAVTSQLFACTGSPMFFSISAEMKHPEHFVRSCLVGNTFLIANYLIIGICMYARAGKYLSSPAFNTAGHTFRIICYAIALFGLFVSCLLITHLGAKYIFVRLLRGTRHLARRTMMHRLVWAVSFAVVIGIGLLLALSIPVFSQLVSLVGALTGGVLVIVLLALLVFYSLSDEGPPAATGGGGGGGVGAAGSTADEKRPPRVTVSEGFEGGRSRRRRHWSGVAWDRGMHGSWADRGNLALAVLLLVLGLFISAGGMYGSVESIIQSYREGAVGQAFSCADNSV